MDAFDVMPDHVHGIGGNAGPRRFGPPTAGLLSTIIRSYKSAVTKRVNEMRDTPGESVWQPRFYDRIIRSRRAWRNVRRYIAANPQRWAGDRLR